LQQLDAGGQLNAPAKGGGTLLSQLSRLGGNPELMAQVVKDVANPKSIRQGQDNEFCAATTALAGMAETDPAGYAKLAADLAVDGQAKTPGGETLKAKPGGGAPGMTATQSLMAPALTEKANGSRLEVNANGVSHGRGRGAERVNGTKANGMERMQEMLQGQQYKSLYIPDHLKLGRARGAAHAERVIDRSLQNGDQPAVSAGGHWYRVTGSSGGQLSVFDQQTGQTQKVDAQQFLRNAEAVTFDARDGHVGLHFKRPGQDELPGGGGSTLGAQNPVEDRARKRW
jgi:hypothetical protein